MEERLKFVLHVEGKIHYVDLYLSRQLREEFI